ncbi:hypothetical protein BDN70DRAFT_918140 [Pholiota conissans]|uniref:Uncharacterized protein n=1 Tax=Pholiota conissans TaxID=109636 RepID=A0A9P5ZBL6_9AGAR|nr:hypothetical protein BDN70DRAFT_918140 [Pholiota conissans]
MATQTFVLPPNLLEPIDTSRIVTRLRRTSSFSFEDLRSSTASPSASLRGIYVRSRAVSPLSESEYLFNLRAQTPRKMSWNPSPLDTTSFATAFSTANANTGNSATSLNVPLNRALDSRRSSWDYQETRGPPAGYSTLVEGDDDQILYMLEERTAKQTATLINLIDQITLALESPAQSSTTTSRPESVTTVTGNNRSSNDPLWTPRGSYSSWTPYSSRRTSVATIVPVRPIRRTQKVADFKEKLIHDTDVDSNRGSIGHEGNGKNRNTVLVSPLAEFGVKPTVEKKGFFGVYKLICKQFDQGTNKQPTTQTTSAMPPSGSYSASAPIGKENVKPPSAVKPCTGTVPGVARPPSIKFQDTVRANELSRSNSGKKGKLVKKQPRKSASDPISNTFQLPTSTATAPLAPRKLAESNPFELRRTASFTGTTTVELINEDPNREWQLPADLDRLEMREALKKASTMRPEDWIYFEFPSKASGPSKESAPAMTAPSPRDSKGEAKRTETIRRR